MCPLRYFDEDDIHEANLYKFFLYGDGPIKEEWEEYDKNYKLYDGLEIPLDMNWHNGKSYDEPTNYYKIHLIAVKYWSYMIHRTHYRTMTELKERHYFFLQRQIGRLIYNQEKINDGDILLFDFRDMHKLKSYKHKDYSKNMVTYDIVGIKMVQYKSFPSAYRKFINVIGPKESYFVDDED